MESNKKENVSYDSLKIQDLSRQLEVPIINPFTEILEQAPLPVVKDEVWLAGGALRSVFDKTPIKDYDYFYYARGDNRTKLAGRLYTYGYIKVPQKHDGYPALIGIHSIERFCHPGLCIEVNLIAYSSKDSLEKGKFIEEFDFTCNQFGTDGTTFVARPNSIFDATSKILRLTPTSGRSVSLARVASFVECKGYTLSEDFWRTVQSTARRKTPAYDDSLTQPPMYQPPIKIHRPSNSVFYPSITASLFKKANVQIIQDTTPSVAGAQAPSFRSYQTEESSSESKQQDKQAQDS